MTVVLLTVPYTAAVGRAAVAAVGADPRPGVRPLDLPAGWADPDPAAPAPPCVRADKYIGPGGEFRYVAFTRRLARVLRAGPAALAVDGSGDVLSLIDAHGHRATEHPTNLMQVLFWHPRWPAVVVHCVPARLRPAYAMAWAKWFEGGAEEPTAQAAEERVAGLVRAAAERRRYFGFGGRLKRVWQRLRGG